MLKRTQTEHSSFTIAKIDLLAPISKISWDFMPKKKTKKNNTKVTPLKKMKKKNIKNQNGHNLNVEKLVISPFLNCH